MPEPVSWSYVDDKRTHHVQTGILRGQRLEFVIQERDLSSKDTEDVYLERHALMEPWEARVHQLQLETRLASLGSYQKSAGLTWAPLRLPVTMRAADMEPLDLRGQGEGIEFHHYSGEEGKHAVTLIAVHEDMPAGRRSFLARLDYGYPDVNGGNLQVIHARLPPSVYRSVLAAQHVELRDLHFVKLHRESGLAMDPRSWSALHAVLDALLARLIAGRLGKPGDAPSGGQRSVLQAIEALALQRRVRDAASAKRSYDTEDELGPTNAGVAGPDVRVRMEELSGDIVKAMNEPRLLALHQRFLLPGEDARLIEEGDLAILRAMREKRDTLDPKERHLMSLLEASLLLRRALAKRTRIDPEVINRVRHAGAYL